MIHRRKLFGFLAAAPVAVAAVAQELTSVAPIAPQDTGLVIQGDKRYFIISAGVGYYTSSNEGATWDIVQS